MNNTERILELFRRSGGRVIKSGEIVDGQFYGERRILSYTERITNARQKLLCTCGQNQDTCTAREHIRNVGLNKYQYVTNIPKEAQKITENKVVSVTDINSRLTQLQAHYAALKSLYIQKKKEGSMLDLPGIEAKGKIVKYQMQLLEKAKPNQLLEDVRGALL